MDPAANRTPDPADLLRAALPGDDAPAPWPPPPLGELAAAFPELTIHELVGQGGMAAVFRATQARLERTVALKVMRPDLAGQPQFAERFLREAKALAALSNQHVLAIHDFGERAGFCYLVTEFVDGANLRELMQLGRLSPTEVLRIVPQVCAGLQFAHAHGVVHRDIKPENVLVDRDGQVKLADFGLAKLAGDGASTFTRSGQVFGTPHYMAPEQWQGSAGVDHRADIYSLGVLLYELLTGRLPVGTYAPASQQPGVPPGIDPIVQRSLQHEPAERYQSAGDVQRELERQREAAGAPVATTASAPSIAKFRSAVSHELKAREKDRRREAWICFVFTLVVAPAAYLHGTPHWPFAAVGLGFASVWLFLTLSKPGRRHASGHAPAARHPGVPSIPPAGAAAGAGRGTRSASGLLVRAVVVLLVGGGALLTLFLTEARRVELREALKAQDADHARIAREIFDTVNRGVAWTGDLPPRLPAMVAGPFSEAYRTTVLVGGGLLVLLATAALLAGARSLRGAPPGARIGRTPRAVLFGCTIVAIMVAISVAEASRMAPWSPSARLPVSADELVGQSRDVLLARLGPPRLVGADAGTMAWHYRRIDASGVDALQIANGVVVGILRGGRVPLHLLPEPMPANGAFAGQTVQELVKVLGPATSSTASTNSTELVFFDGTTASVDRNGFVVRIGR